MNHEITLEQVKERLVPVLQKIGWIYTLDSKGEDRKRWSEIHHVLNELFLDISVTADKQEVKPDRDTQFSGYAKLLVEELLAKMKYSIGRTSQDIEKGLEDLVARRSYDFAKHTMSHVGQGMAAENEGGPLYLEENMRCIPDMTEWPMEDNNA